MFEKVKNKHLKKLLIEFNNAAQNYGWSKDQGSVLQVQKSQYELEEAERKLTNYLNKKFDILDNFNHACFR